jgi:hypothetical protein
LRSTFIGPIPKLSDTDFRLSYFKTEEDSDCTIVCGPYHFKVHKILIGSHSEYFRTALKANNFKVSAERCFEYH